MVGFTEFLLLSPSLAGFSFNSYYDNDGVVHFIPDKTNENGIVEKYRFKFNTNNRVLRIPNAQKEKIAFLKNAPWCEGSPNAGVDQKFYYKEVNTEKDAATVVENEGIRIGAQSKALSLKGQDLADIALLCGTYSPSESIQRKRVLDYSGSNPSGFIAMIESPDFKTRALLRRAISKSVITKKGFLFMWGDEHLGNDEDAVVQRLMKDKAIYKAVDEKINK